MAMKQRITCVSCSSYFIITTVVSKVKCPKCGVINELAPEPVKESIYQNISNVPQFSINEVSTVAKQLLEEPLNYWAEVRVGYDGVYSCYKKLYGLDKEKNEVYVTKAFATIFSPMSVIWKVYWNNELDWDSGTVANIKILEENGSNRLLYKEYKTTSAATLRNDVVVRAVYEEYYDSIWCYAVSERETIPAHGGFRRGYLVLSGLLIKQVEDNRCEVKFVHSFDFGGWIHVKFIDEESKKVGLRLSKIKKKAEDDFRTLKPKAARVLPVQTSTTIYSENCVCKVCPLCNRISDTLYCGDDGTQTNLCCRNCYNPVTGTNFCGECGNKLV